MSEEEGSGILGFLVLALVLFLLAITVYFLFKKSDGDDGDDDEKKERGSGSPGGGTNDETPPVATIRDMNVEFIDNDSIVIRKTSNFQTGAEYGYFFFTLYDVESMDIPYARGVRSLSYDVYMFSRENLQNDTRQSFGREHDENTYSG